jgi:hypothetical protein
MRDHDTSPGAKHTTESQPGLSDALRAALAAAAAGMAVFPLRGKIPAIKGGAGCKDASRNRGQILGMFNAAPGATGYGIATGSPSGRIAVDIDGPEAQREAERLGLTSGYTVRTGREDGGRHLYFTIPAGVQVRSRILAPGLEVKADGAYVAGPGSMHPSGRPYRIERGGDPSPAPAWLIGGGAERSATRDSSGPVSIDTAGPAIPDGGRNRTLASIAGRLHDGSRTLADLKRDLLAINAARCSPPLEEGEVAKIAASIHRLEPCTPRPQVSERVLEKIAVLRHMAEGRPVRGREGATGWAICHAGLDLAPEYGGDHADGVTLTVSRRTWAQMAGTDNATVTRWIKRSPLVELIDPGSGTRPSTVLFKLPLSDAQIGGYLHQLSTRGASLENGPGASDADNPLFRTLYRSRWSERGRKAESGVVPGTPWIRQRRAPRREGRTRRGKSRSYLLDLIRRNPDAAKRDLASLKGVKPGSLTKPLRWLLDAGLIVRTSRGRYAVADALEQRVEDARELAGEPEADRLQIIRDALDRAKYRHWLAGSPTPATPPASEAAYQRSRARHERENARPRPEPTPAADRLQEAVRDHVREGMSYRLAVREVFGPESREYADALQAAAREREEARNAPERGGRTARASDRASYPVEHWRGFVHGPADDRLRAGSA